MESTRITRKLRDQFCSQLTDQIRKDLTAPIITEDRIKELERDIVELHELAYFGPHPELQSVIRRWPLLLTETPPAAADFLWSQQVYNSVTVRPGKTKVLRTGPTLNPGFSAKDNAFNPVRHLLKDIKLPRVPRNCYVGTTYYRSIPSIETLVEGFGNKTAEWPERIQQMLTLQLRINSWLLPLLSAPGESRDRARQLTAMLAQFTTTKALEKGWPEGFALLKLTCPEIGKKASAATSKVVVPVETARQVNHLIQSLHKTQGESHGV